MCHSQPSRPFLTSSLQPQQVPWLLIGSAPHGATHCSGPGTQGIFGAGRGPVLPSHRPGRRSRLQTPLLHLLHHSSCVRVGVIPLDPASPALQQASQLTQVSGVLNGGLLPPLQEPSRTQGEPEAVPDVNRSTSGPLGRRTFRLFVGMQELSVWNLPGKAAPAFFHLLPSPCRRMSPRPLPLLEDFLCCTHTTLAPAVLSPRAEQSISRDNQSPLPGPEGLLFPRFRTPCALVLSGWLTTSPRSRMLTLASFWLQPL